MKALGAAAQIFLFALLLVGFGCEPVASELPSPADSSSNLPSAYTSYTPAKINIMPLTEFICVDDVEEALRLRVYVGLLDSFDCQIKSPGVFRFELYEKVLRRAEPKGKRIIIWPDIDLTDAVENNEHWRDFLRAYEFDLDFEPAGGQSYVLQVTCLCPNGKRLSAELALKRTE